MQDVCLINSKFNDNLMIFLTSLVHKPQNLVNSSPLENALNIQSIDHYLIYSILFNFACVTDF